jgi:hypothetical protein
MQFVMEAGRKKNSDVKELKLIRHAALMHVNV